MIANNTGDLGSMDIDQVSPHFKLSEFACHDGCGGERKPDILSEIRKTAAMLELIRAESGNRPVHLDCGYRCPSHNAAVGGASNSFHMVGKAADITIEGMTPLQVQVMVTKIAKVGGIGHYNSFTHVDTGPRRTWTD